MFLSDFSIKRPIATIVIIIGLMALGLLALNKLRVNQIPDVEQPVMVVNVPYPGASPETVEREHHQPGGERRCKASPVSTRYAPPPPATAARRSSSSSTSARTWWRRRTKSATPSPRCATSCRWKCASRVLQRIDPAAPAHHAAGAVPPPRSPTPRSRAWPRTTCPTSSAAWTAWRWSPSTARCGARTQRVLLRAEEAARVQHLGQRCRQRAAGAEHHGAGGAASSARWRSRAYG